MFAAASLLWRFCGVASMHGKVASLAKAVAQDKSFLRKQKYK
jgi:hypothetical protein